MLRMGVLEGGKLESPQQAQLGDRHGEGTRGLTDHEAQAWRQRGQPSVMGVTRASGRGHS